MRLETLANAVCEYLDEQIISFSVVPTHTADMSAMPKCIVEVEEDGEEIVGYASRMRVTATLYIEAAHESAKSMLDAGTRDLELAFAPELLRQGASTPDVLIDGVLTGASASNLDGEVWTRSKTVTVFCRG